MTGQKIRSQVTEKRFLKAHVNALAAGNIALLLPQSNHHGIGKMGARDVIGEG